MEEYSLHLVEDPKLLLPVLEERHPNSCFIFNQAKVSHKFKNDLIFYTISTSINSSTWIVSDYIREDYGHCYSISAPTPITKGVEPIPPQIKECFATSPIINWDESLAFIAEKPVSAMIMDISVNIHGNVSELHPSILYYMDLEQARNLSVSTQEAQLSRLDPKTGTEFVVSIWEYTKEGSEQVIRKSIEANASAGILIDGEWASSVIINGDGLLHCLYTKKEYRQKGFGKITMQYAMKEFAKDGCIPCSTVELKNKRSIAFHESLGVKVASMIDGILIKKLDID